MEELNQDETPNDGEWLDAVQRGELPPDFTRVHSCVQRDALVFLPASLRDLRSLGHCLAAGYLGRRDISPDAHGPARQEDLAKAPAVARCCRVLATVFRSE